MRLRPPFPLSAPSRRARGFTLLELLVAVGVTAAVALFIVAIVSNVSSFWTRSAGRMTAEAQARFILDQIALDLGGAIFRDDGNVYLAANIVSTANGNPGTPWQIAPSNAKQVGGVSLDLAATRTDLPASVRGQFSYARYSNGGAWLRFFTTRRGTNDAASATTALSTASAPVAVGYQLLRRFTATSTVAPGGTRTGYMLHRVEARAAAVNGRPGVFESGYQITSAAYTTSTATTNNGAQTGDPRTIQVVSTNTHNLDSVIGENVVDFGVRAYVRDARQPTGLRLVFPASDSNGTISTVATARLISSLPANTTPTSANFNQVFPDVIDVMVRILTDEGARLIAAYEANPATPAATGLPNGRNAQQYWWDIAEANSKVFTRRIVLNAKTPLSGKGAFRNHEWTQKNTNLSQAKWHSWRGIFLYHPVRNGPRVQGLHWPSCRLVPIRGSTAFSRLTANGHDHSSTTRDQRPTNTEDGKTIPQEPSDRDPRRGMRRGPSRAGVAPRCVGGEAERICAG